MPSSMKMTSDDIIKHLNLMPHPEGGYFRETFRDDPDSTGRSASTSIYYLLSRGEQSRWHRIDSAEIWHYYAGAPLALTIETEENSFQEISLGPDILSSQHPQAIVPPGRWQRARSTDAWTLVGCTVAPGFDFSRFHLATAGEEKRLNEKTRDLA